MLFELFKFFFITGIILSVFFSGSMLGFYAAEEEFCLNDKNFKNKEKMCDACDKYVKDAVYCDECVDEADMLKNAVNEKIKKLEYELTSLKSKTLLDPPSVEELYKNNRENADLTRLSNSIQNLTKMLDIKYSTSFLDDKIQELQDLSWKWLKILHREKKIDDALLETHDNTIENLEEKIETNLRENMEENLEKHVDGNFDDKKDEDSFSYYSSDDDENDYSKEIEIDLPKDFYAKTTAWKMNDSETKNLKFVY